MASSFGLQAEDDGFLGLQHASWEQAEGAGGGFGHPVDAAGAQENLVEVTEAHIDAQLEQLRKEVEAETQQGLSQWHFECHVPEERVDDSPVIVNEQLQLDNAVRMAQSHPFRQFQSQKDPRLLVKVPFLQSYQGLDGPMPGSFAPLRCASRTPKWAPMMT